MSRSFASLALSTTLLLPAATALGGITCPNEFEDPTNALGPISAFFGGVTSWGTTPSSATIHTGKSLEVWANLIDDSFAAAGFTVGTFGITPPALNVAPTADTFSITIQSPAAGQLSIKVTLREDDNGDGLIQVNGADDQWESLTIMLAPGTNAYNIPFAAFQDLNPDNGNGVRNFTTTGKLAYFLTFETRDAYPGGQIIGPVSFLIDHAGLYVGPQTVPSAPVIGDITGDGGVNIDDLLAVINGWGACPLPPAACPADIAPVGPPAGNGVVNIDDLLLVINNWG